MSDRFYKLSGGGNDFIALAEPESEPTPETIQAWCRRGLSVGADGFFVLRRKALGQATMSYCNADGYPADLCLNGTRCAGRLGFELGWEIDGRLEIVTTVGSFAAQADDATAIAVAIPDELGPSAAEPKAVTAVVDDRSFSGHWIDTGVPHFVLAWPDGLSQAPVERLGRPLRHNQAFPGGANVDFVHWAGDHRIELRTYERGVEAETLACGTGVVAAVQVGLHLEKVRLPVSIVTAGGFVYEVRNEDGRWFLSGDARIVAEGAIVEGAMARPQPPAWTKP